MWSLKCIVTVLDSLPLLTTKVNFSELSAQENFLFSPFPVLLNYCIWVDGRITVLMMLILKHKYENSINHTKRSCIQLELLKTKFPIDQHICVCLIENKQKQVSEQLDDRSRSSPHPCSCFAPTSPWWLCSAISNMKRLYEHLPVPQA